MLDLSVKNNVVVEPMDAPSAEDLAKATSAVGHADFARVLGVPYNRINVKADKDTELWIAQIVGGRLAEGATELPAGAKFVWVKVTLS